MKKRILSILLTLCMVLCLVPITVFAAGGAKAILPGTSAQSILKIDKSRLSFAGHEWWVIGQKTDKSNNAPIITLLAVNNDFGDVPFRTGSAVPFENASRYSEDNGYYANNPSDMSQWRKPNEYAGSTLQQKMVSLAEAIPEKEQAVIRPKDITEGITGQEVKAQKLWAFSQEDSIYLYRNSCKYAAQWWTRSSNEVYGYGSWTIHPDGRSGSALNVDYDAAVRPAMEMDLSSVLFISAAEHGKVADLTTPIAEYAGDEWKLTLHDSDRDDFTAKTVLVNGSVLEVEYKNAKVGDNEYISAVIKDADGSISRYARVVQLDGTTNGTRGRAAIDLTGIDMTGKTLCVFNEQFNGDHKTDYAGALREVKLTDEIDEQFTLTPGGRYYFDLSAMNIPGTANGDLPDSTLHYVPFTYAGTVNAYKLTTEMATTEEYAQKNKYPHSLFVADYAVTNDVSWDALNTADLIFGKNYASGGVDYTLRAPSVGSSYTGSGNSERGVPQSNEWDTMLNKDSGYIQNWNEMYSWGQGTVSDDASFRAVRGYDSARLWNNYSATNSSLRLGFRPVLEVLNPDTLGSDGLKVVTLDLNGGKLGGSSEDIQIIVKNGSTFTAPMSGGLTRPDGDTGSYFMWLGSNGKLYAPGASVPADVTELTVQWTAPTYAVTLHANGGSVSPDSVTTGADGKLASLPTPTRSSYSFNGWYTEKNGGTKVTTDTVFSANTTVYAHWTYTGGGYYYPPVTYYTLRFETGGGSDIPSVREAYNAYIDLSQYVPTWRGHTFIDWYSERSLTNKVSGVYLTKDMTVYAGWRVDENPGTGANPFTDVSEKDWFYSDVMFVYENGLMLGTSKTLFSPHGTATRGMMATILWRMEGSPAPKGKNSFTDVEAGKWYADAITWTAENGIFAGYGKDKFGPDDPITREQLAAIFYRYADYKGYDLTVKGNLDTFKDADKITDYAKTAMQWAVGSGLMKGKSGNLLDPQGTATRAEIAAMLHRFIEKYELVQGKAPGGLMGWIDPKRLQIPKTGDSSVLGLWGFSLCTSLAGCLALTTWQIRRRREEQSLQSIEK